MPLHVMTHHDPGRTLWAMLQQVSQNGTRGNYWSQTAGAWQSAPSTVDKRIALSEGSGIHAGIYAGGVTTITGYDGDVIVSIHDEGLSYTVVGQGHTRLYNGTEQTPFTGDVSLMPAAVRAELNSNPVPSSNMRGTDNALLASSYTAPNNSGITTAATQSTAAATSSATAAAEATLARTTSQSVDAKLTTTRATKLDFLDAAITTRSSHTPAAVRSELNSNPVPASNMRGTDNAMLAASYVAPNNSGITTAAADALAAKTSAQTTEARLTATRAGYLDNLSAGPVATAASVSAIAAGRSTVLVGPGEAHIPTSGSTTYTLEVYLYNSASGMESPDSAPVFAAENSAGASRTSNLGAVTNPSTGVYRTTYVVSSAHAQEAVTVSVAAVEGGQTQRAAHVLNVFSPSSLTGTFSTTDRTQLQAIFGKLPSRAFITGTDASDGDINLDNCDGSRTPFRADVSLLATAASVSAVPAAVRSELNSNPVPASNMRGTDNALTAAAYTAPANAAIATAASQATAAATSAASAVTEATAAKTAAQLVEGRVTPTRASMLDNLDVAVSTRSSFNPASDTVSLGASHGLATAATAAAIKAKTDLIPETPASTSDVPTASQVAAQVEATMVSSHGAGAYNVASDATLANQVSILSAIATINPPAPSGVAIVARQRVWTLLDGGEDTIAPNIIVLPVGASVILAMDFAQLLNDGTGLSAVANVTDISGNGLSISQLAVSQDRTRAHFLVGGLVADKRYELKVITTTTDGQSLTGRGVLRSEA